MFKMLLTLARGRAFAAAEEFGDQNALLLLDQQVRDASVALDRAKKALALALAQDQLEAKRLDGIGKGIADLETRVIAALAGGREDLGREGAEAIARLESDRDAAATARSLFATEISRLRAHVGHAETRIAAVERGRRIARAAEAVGRARAGRLGAAPPHEATLTEAEATLKRLRERQTETQIAEDELDRIDAATGPAAAAEKLAAEGFGPKLRTTADDVLARLRTAATPQSAVA